MFPDRMEGFKRGEADRLAGKDFSPILARRQWDDYGDGYYAGWMPRQPNEEEEEE